MNIQTDTSENALLTATRANICDLFRRMSRSNEPEHFEKAGLTRWYSVVPHPWFNGLIADEPPTPESEAALEESLQYFKDKKVETFTFWVAPNLKPADWESTLKKHGFGFSQDTPGMALDLNDLNTSAPKVDGLEIRIVEDMESMKEWAKVFTPGYGLPSAWQPMIVEAWGNLGFDLPMRNYIGYLNGKPVSTSCLFLGGGAAGIYSVSTLPEARGKGIGAAVTLKPLLDAREMGYRIGTLQSSDMGFNIYKKLGFRHLCQIENFYLANKQ